MATAASCTATDEKSALQIIRERYGFDHTVSDERIFYCSRMIHDGSRDIDLNVSQELERFKAVGTVPYHIIRCSQDDVRYDQGWVSMVKR